MNPFRALIESHITRLEELAEDCRKEAERIRRTQIGRIHDSNEPGLWMFENLFGRADAYGSVARRLKADLEAEDARPSDLEMAMHIAERKPRQAADPSDSSGHSDHDNYIAGCAGCDSKYGNT